MLLGELHARKVGLEEVFRLRIVVGGIGRVLLPRALEHGVVLDFERLELLDCGWCYVGARNVEVGLIARNTQ